MTRTKRAVTEIFNNLSAETELVALYINNDKSKYLHIERIGERNIPVHINHIPFEEVLISRIWIFY